MKILVVTTLILVSAISSCHYAQAQARVVPDNDLTPGAVIGTNIEDMQIEESPIQHAKRPSMKAAELRKVAAAYHLKKGEKVAEYDHRIPYGCWGTTDAQNIWPQSSPAKKFKDRLEHQWERWVTQKKFTVGQCQAAFKAPGDWRDLYYWTYGRKPL